MSEENKNKKILRFMSSWDDGFQYDLKVAALLQKFSLPAVFYIPSCCELDDKDLIQLSKSFEIGGHTVSHFQDLKKLSIDELDFELTDNRQWLQELTGQAILRFCYPRGRYNESVMERVKAAGFKQARTTLVMHTIFPEPYRQHTSIQVLQRMEYYGLTWDVMARRLAQQAADTGECFHLWGHSIELERKNEWPKLQEFFEWLIKNFMVVNAYGADADIYYMAPLTK